MPVRRLCPRARRGRDVCRGHEHPQGAGVAEKMGVSRLSMDQVCAIASCLNADIEERSDDMATLLLSNYSMRCLKRALQDNLALVVRGTSLVPGF